MALGIDIGSYAVKLVETVNSASGPALKSSGLKKIKGPSRANASSALKELTGELNITAKEANISVSGPSVLVRFLSMPKMKDEEMKSAVRFEAEKIIPFNLNDCIIDYHVIADTPGGKSDLILVAAKDGYVRDLIGTVEECGFTVRVVDVDSLAVINAFSRYKKDLAVDKGIALVNIGAKSTNLAIIHGGAVCFIRDLASAGNDFSASVSRSLNIDASSAEDIKISPNEKMQAVINAVRQTLGDLSDDIKLSFNYYENQSGHGVDEIYLSGGSAALAGIEAFFQESFGVVPFFWNPLEPFSATGGMAGAKETTAMSGSFGVAAGLALR